MREVVPTDIQIFICAIVDARAKGPFKNWDDFVARKVLPANAEAAIKDKVTF